MLGIVASLSTFIFGGVAMAYCANCGKEISVQAVMCPACGHPGPEKLASNAARGELASWGSRLGGTIIDAILLLIPMALIFFATIAPLLRDADIDDEGNITGISSADAGTIALAAVLAFIVFALYKPMFEGHNGQTLGKMMVHIRVVRAEDGSRIGYGKAFFRWFMSTLIGAVGPLNLINYLWPLWDDDNQTLHDKAAKTVVVKVS